EFFDIGGVAFEPHPVQQPRPPIWIGGNSPAALRRAARHEGWQPNPVTMTAAEVPAALEYIRSQPEFAGKEDTFDVHFLVGWLGDGAPRSGEGRRAPMRAKRHAAGGPLAGYGATTMSVPPPGPNSQPDSPASLRWSDKGGAFASRSCPAARTAVGRI